jgi:hypothetical protein
MSRHGCSTVIPSEATDLQLRSGMRRLVSGLMVAAVTSCGVFDAPIVCDASMAPGIVVRAVDSTTGADHPFANMAIDVASISGAAYLDSVRIASVDSAGQATRAFAWERPGTYSVLVKASGYADWKTGVSVNKDRCHVHGELVTARLQRR